MALKHGLVDFCIAELQGAQQVPRCVTRWCQGTKGKCCRVPKSQWYVIFHLAESVVSLFSCIIDEDDNEDTSFSVVCRVSH